MAKRTKMGTANEQLNVSCQFDGVTAGRDKLSITCVVDVGKVNLGVMHDTVVGAQLQCTLQVVSGGARQDAGGQDMMRHVVEAELDGVFSCRQLSVNKRVYKFRLTIDGSAVQEEEFFALRYNAGQLQCSRIGDVDDKPPKEGT